MEVRRVGRVQGLVALLVVGVMAGNALAQNRPGESEPDIEGLVVLIRAVLNGLAEVEERLRRVEERLTAVEASQGRSAGYSVRFF